MKDKKLTTQDNKSQEVIDDTTVEEPVKQQKWVEETTSGKDTNNIQEGNNPLAEVDNLTAQLTVANEKYIRLYSEFENYKKRAIKEKKATIDTANSSLLKNLLPVIDDFERGMTLCVQEHNTDTQQAIQDGMKLIYEKFTNLLKQAGVSSMQIDKGADFDEAFHNAVAKTAVEEASMKRKVVDVIEKGYLLNTHVLRFAKVVIGS